MKKSLNSDEMFTAFSESGVLEESANTPEEIKEFLFMVGFREGSNSLWESKKFGLIVPSALKSIAEVVDKIYAEGRRDGRKELQREIKSLIG